MSKICSQCGKGPKTGSNISHSHRKTKRRFLPNLIIKKVFDTTTGMMVKKKLCAKCLKTMIRKEVA